jgi:peptidoglycan/LPS O-acetylase OafA/YrhL
LRGLSSIWVWAYHLGERFTTYANIPIVSAGYLGVSVFFILSISLLLERLEVNQDLKRYFIRRIKRTWPMYFASVAIVFLVYSHTTVWLAEQVSFLGVFLDNNAIDYVFWSLQIEEVAYLTFPLLARLSKRNLLWVGTGLYAFGIALTFVLWPNAFNVLSFWWLPFALTAYGVGIVVYLRKVPHVALFLAPFVLLYFDNRYLVMASGLVAPFFGYVVQNSAKWGWLKNAALVFLGDISYGTYLIHYVLMTTLGLLGVVLTIPLAWAFEKLGNLNR